MALKPEQMVKNVTIEASEDLQTTNRFINFDGAYAGAGEVALGVLDMETDSGKAASVKAIGIVIVEAGAAVAKGDPVASDADGRAVTAGPGTVVNGYAIDAAAAAGDLIRMIIR